MRALDFATMTASDLQRTLIKLYREHGENAQETARVIGRKHISGQTVTRLCRARIAQGEFRPEPGTALALARAMRLSPTQALEAGGWLELADYLRECFGEPTSLPHPDVVPLFADPLFTETVQLWHALENNQSGRQMIAAFWAFVRETVRPPGKQRRTKERGTEAA